MAWDFWKKLTGKDKGTEPPPEQKPAAATTAEAPADEASMLASLKGLRGGMGQIMKLMRDPKIRKQFEALVERMQKDGVKVTDRKAVEEWVEKHKSELGGGEGAPRAETFVRAEPEVGRNEPCHCGSGKKLKKCHGAGA